MAETGSELYCKELGVIGRDRSTDRPHNINFRTGVLHEFTRQKARVVHCRCNNFRYIVRVAEWQWVRYYVIVIFDRRQFGTKAKIVAAKSMQPIMTLYLWRNRSATAKREVYFTWTAASNKLNSTQQTPNHKYALLRNALLPPIQLVVARIIVLWPSNIFTGYAAQTGNASIDWFRLS